ncbi:MAG: hypothetical protein E7397_01765 [Ruminococcaceae bacterium]|nr:hypothetical protein [Oscillospiraceae bacterium]
MVYYGLISLCAVMFGTQFFFNQIFQKSYGSDFRAALVQSAGSALIGAIVLSLTNGFSLGYTHFSFVMSLLVALNGKLFSFCSLKSLGKINLSLYSTFSMLGGMALPFVVGILFFNEALTIGKCICFLFITAALFMTVEKSEKRSGTIFYIGIFVFNGMSGVLAKIYQAAPFAKVSATEYSILCAITAFIMSVILLCFVKGEKKKLNLKAVWAIFGSSVLNRFANLWLLISLAVLPASAQYPFITGGTMIVSTVIAYLTHQKPSKKELISVALSFIGLLALVLVP